MSTTATPAATPGRTNPARRGPLLAEMRRGFGVSRRAAAEYAGVPFAELVAYEDGRRTPSPSVALRISRGIVTAHAVGGAARPATVPA